MMQVDLSDAGFGVVNITGINQNYCCRGCAMLEPCRVSSIRFFVSFCELAQMGARQKKRPSLIPAVVWLAEHRPATIMTADVRERWGGSYHQARYWLITAGYRCIDMRRGEWALQEVDDDSA